jgi:hypothetical protein
MPRLGARKGSNQSKATNLITMNQANAGKGGTGSAAGVPQAGTGGATNGADGQNLPGTAGHAGVSGTGLGGGSASGGSVMIDNTNVTGNSASTADNDVSVITES